MALEKELRDMFRLIPEQRVLINDFYSRFEGLGAFNITAAEPLYYHGPIAGSVFTVYDANILYLCLDVIFGCDHVCNAFNGTISFYDEINVLLGIYTNQDITFDTVAFAPNYMKNKLGFTNLWFSRIIALRYNYMKFIGYQITY